MKAAYGDQKAREIMIDGTPHVMIFPNLFIAEIQMFVIQPLAVDDSVQHVTALQFKGAPDMNRRLRQQTMGSVGPAGLLLADDSEMYERCHRGVLARNPEWIFLAHQAIANGQASHPDAAVAAAPDHIEYRVAEPTGGWRYCRRQQQPGVRIQSSGRYDLGRPERISAALRRWRVAHGL